MESMNVSDFLGCQQLAIFQCNRVAQVSTMYFHFKNNASSVHILEVYLICARVTR